MDTLVSGDATVGMGGEVTRLKPKHMSSVREFPFFLLITRQRKSFIDSISQIMFGQAEPSVPSFMLSSLSG